MGQFDHEKLQVWNVAADFVGRAQSMAREVPRGSGDFADQLRRAASSITLNIADGAGEYAPREKARFYRLAKRSTMECAALVDLYRRLELCEPAATDVAREDLLRVVSMLVRLIKATEGNGDRQQRGHRYR
jgi:four helix bundle protein